MHQRTAKTWDQNMVAWKLKPDKIVTFFFFLRKESIHAYSRLMLGLLAPRYLQKPPPGISSSHQRSEGGAPLLPLTSDLRSLSPLVCGLWVVRVGISIL